MIPIRNANTSIFMGRLTGSNQMGASLMSGLLKNVVAITLTASPKKLPNIKPQNAVEIPQYMNIFMNFLIPSSMFLNLVRQYAVPAIMISP